MTKNRIYELRKNRKLQQGTLGAILSTSQQSISRMESGLCDIPNDLLIRMAKYFNVTTDYILGISEMKRDLGCQFRMNQELDEYYDIVLRYKNLGAINQKTFLIILERLEESQMELVENVQEKINYKVEGEKDAKDSSL